MVPPSSQKQPCWRCAEFSSSPFCPKCDALNSVPEGTHFFAVFGLEPTLAIEEASLRETFYRLSQALHPDRFAQSPETRDLIYSTQWSTLLNRAYQTLRDPIKRSYYLLELLLVPSSKSSQVPLDLAETYFELQEALLEPGGSAPLHSFLQELENKSKDEEKHWETLRDRWDQSKEKANLLEELRDHLHKRRYLSSMREDIERKLEGMKRP